MEYRQTEAVWMRLRLSAGIFLCLKNERLGRYDNPS